MKKLILLLSIIISSQIAWAQSPVTEKADTAFTRKTYSRAIELYKKALKKERKKGKRKNEAVLRYIDYQLAEIYHSLINFKEARNWYNKAITDGYSEPIAIYNLGDMYMMEGNYGEALNNFEQYLQTTEEPDARVHNKIESCKYAMGIEEKKPKYIISNEQKLNSRYSDYGPAQVSNRIIFATTRILKDTKKIDPYTGESFSDLYESTYDSKSYKWIRPVPLKGEINSRFNEGTLTFDYGKNTAYYTQCNGLKGKDNKCGIYSSVYDPQKNEWAKPEPVDLNEGDFSVGHPALNSAGNMMYVVSDMTGGFGGTDIWISRKNAEGKWSSLVNAGKTINTKGNEMFPFVFEDTLLYFASDGYIGFGGLDIYYSRIKNDGFATPENILLPINSSADDFGIIFLGVDSGMFCSNRIGGLGEDDIYTFRPIPKFSLAYDKLLFKVFGTVNDKTDNSPIANALVILKNSDGGSDTTLTNTSGFYAFESLKSQATYSVDVIKPGYLNDSKPMSTKEEILSKDYAISAGNDMNFSLIKVSREEIIIPNIYYDYNKWNLREASRTELDKKVAVLKSNPDLHITIYSHTDERGNEDYNLGLSEKRAQAVIDYFNKKGVSMERLSAKGMGKSNPLIVGAKTETEHQMNRRTTFIIQNINDSIAIHDSICIVNFNKRLEKKKEKALGPAYKNNVRPKDEISVRVLFAFSKDILVPVYYKEVEETVPDTKVQYQRDGVWYRYTIGSFNNLPAAMDVQEKLKKNGIRSILTFTKGDKELSMNEALWLFDIIKNITPKKK